MRVDSVIAGSLRLSTHLSSFWSTRPGLSTSCSLSALFGDPVRASIQDRDRSLTLNWDSAWEGRIPGTAGRTRELPED